VPVVGDRSPRRRDGPGGTGRLTGRATTSRTCGIGPTSNSTAIPPPAGLAVRHLPRCAGRGARRVPRGLEMLVQPRLV